MGGPEQGLCVFGGCRRHRPEYPRSIVSLLSLCSSRKEGTGHGRTRHERAGHGRIVSERHGYPLVLLITYWDKINGYVNDLNDLPISIVDFTTNYNISINMRNYKYNHHWRSWRCSNFCYPFYYEDFWPFKSKKNQYCLFIYLDFYLVFHF
jgi:hypothetical protein